MSNLKIFTQNIEPEAKRQIDELLAQPAFSQAKVRIMPDVHAGAGCVIGFTADLGDKVIPNVVGVDIGCGVRVAKLNKKINIDFEILDNFIKINIPSGFDVNEDIQKDFNLKELYCYGKLRDIKRLACGIGSLGGGNHFIEVDVDSQGNQYIIVHTGSRNLGKQVADIYQCEAIDYCNKTNLKEIIDAKIVELTAQNRKSEISDALREIYAQHKQYKVANALAFIENEARDRYLHDMKLCQQYAVYNREVILNKILKFLNVDAEVFESIHNYIDDNNMVRKGAISAHAGQKVIIPLNMRDGAIIGIGKGNVEWNESAPHGAGRIMSRSEARKTLSLEDFKNTMKGIYTTTAQQNTIDEAPMAYKNAQEIIDAIGETVEIIELITPIYNFKASD